MSAAGQLGLNLVTEAYLKPLTFIDELTDKTVCTNADVMQVSSFF